MSKRYELDLGQDEGHERLELRLMVAGRVLIFLFVLAAALGLTGPGWWSSHRQAKDGVVVRYLRSVHRGSPADIELEIDARFVRDGQVAVWLSSAWLEEMQLDEWRPPPASSRVESSRTVLAFAADAAGPLALRLRSSRRGMGAVRGELGILGGPSFELRQFAFP